MYKYIFFGERGRERIWFSDQYISLRYLGEKTVFIDCIDVTRTTLAVLHLSDRSQRCPNYKLHTEKNAVRQLHAC
jgi:hypothetical protein